MIDYVLFIIGIIILVKGADFLVEGSSSLANKLGIPTLVIGLTIVAFGTSTPELIVNVFAAIKGSPDIAFGNIIGSNIANIFLVLGVTAIIRPIVVKRDTVWKEIPFSLLAVIVLFLVSNYFIQTGFGEGGNFLTRFSGLILLSFFAVFIYYSVDLAVKNKRQIDKKTLEITRSGLKIFLFIVGGLLGLYFGGKLVVEGAISMAQFFGLSEFFISATAIALGTSLPELSTGIAAAIKNETDLAVGNAVGSNIFNIFWILGITAVIAPLAIPGFINTDIIILGIATFLLFISLFVGKKHNLERWQGVIFVLFYIFYIIFLINRG